MIKRANSSWAVLAGSKNLSRRGVKGEIALGALQRFSQSPALICLWVLLSGGLTTYLLLRAHKFPLLIRVVGPILSLVYVAYRWKEMIWDLLLIRTAADLLLGTRTRATRVDDNLYLGMIPMREDGGDALLSKKLNVNALVSLLPLSLTRKWRSLVGTPVSREEW